MSTEEGEEGEEEVEEVEADPAGFGEDAGQGPAEQDEAIEVKSP